MLKTLAIAIAITVLPLSAHAEVVQVSNIVVSGGNTGFDSIMDPTTAATVSFDLNQTEGVYLVQETGPSSVTASEEFTAKKVSDNTNHDFEIGDQIDASLRFHFDPVAGSGIKDIIFSFDVDTSNLPAGNEWFLVGPRAQLLNSDFLSPGTGNWSGSPRGFESGDSFTLSNIGTGIFRIDVDSATSAGGMDGFRLISAPVGNPVPEPTSIVLVGLAVLCLGGAQRR